MLTWEPLYKARKNGNINFSDAKGQLALWSVVGSGWISNSSKLLCMSSLPVSMKRIPSRTTEKKLQHHFPNYNTICCHGNQWSDLAEFQTHPSFYACPHCLQVWKGSNEKWRRKCDDIIFSIISLWDFSQTLKGSQLRGPWSELAEFRTHSSSYVYHRYLQVWNESDQKRSRKRDDAVFPTITLSVAMETSGQSGRISNSFKLLCMSSLPANMKRI